MDESVARINKLSNGYTVEVCDPAQQEKNKSPKNSYASPWKTYAFSSPKEVLAFLTKVLANLKPADDDMSTSFQRAIESED